VTTRSRIVPGDGDPRHGTANGYANLGCRGPDCRRANAEAAAAQRAARKATPVPEWVHGTIGGYTNWGCRCGPCNEARRADEAQRDGRPLAPRATPSPCGTNASYGRGCRCDECRGAHAAYMRQRRIKQRQASG
jgi:hypothetical protein